MDVEGELFDLPSDVGVVGGDADWKSLDRAIVR